MPRVPFDELCFTLTRALRNLGLAPARATLSARLIAETDCDGVSTHGVARVPRFAEMVRLGRIDPLATPSLTASLGAIERWTGNLGPGNLAAHAAMFRAIELATAHGLGAVALAETTHWQRGGSFGWQAAEAGFAAICWSNTLANLPPWGGTTPALGNNPLVIAVPNPAPSGHTGHVVLDMAMSQFSYGTLTAFRERGQLLPQPGGYDAQGVLTRDPAVIEATQRALPAGFWKGSGLAFALDILAALLAGGKATHQIPRDPLRETGQSQVFLAFAPGHSPGLSSQINDAIQALQGSAPAHPPATPRYPGQHTLELRRRNLQLGVPVPFASWNQVRQLAATS